MLVGLLYLVWSDKVQIILGPRPRVGTEAAHPSPAKAAMFAPIAPQAPQRSQPTSSIVLPGGTAGNTAPAIDPGFAQRNQLSSREAASKLDKCRDYVERFSPVAVAEQQKFGIPASVILAQGLLETNAGESQLARKANNHFGVKCFSKRCAKGHCMNHSDDSHKDFFVRYGNAWASYRAHSQFLKNSRRYNHLFQLGHNDYRAWARGLAKAGYATDRQYGEKLIALIQNMNLTKFDF